MTDLTATILLVVGSGGLGGLLGAWLSWVNEHKRLKNDIEADLRQELRADYARVKEEYVSVRIEARKMRRRIFELERLLANHGIPVPANDDTKA